MKNYASRENCDSRAWCISTLILTLEQFSKILKGKTFHNIHIFICWIFSFSGPRSSGWELLIWNKIKARIKTKNKQWYHCREWQRNFMIELKFIGKCFFFSGTALFSTYCIIPGNWRKYRGILVSFFKIITWIVTFLLIPLLWYGESLYQLKLFAINLIYLFI